MTIELDRELPQWDKNPFYPELLPLVTNRLSFADLVREEFRLQQLLTCAGPGTAIRTVAVSYQQPGFESILKLEDGYFLGVAKFRHEDKETGKREIRYSLEFQHVGSKSIVRQVIERPVDPNLYWRAHREIRNLPPNLRLRARRKILVPQVIQVVGCESADLLYENMQLVERIAAFAKEREKRTG